MSAAAEIRQYAERIARLEIERRELASDVKDVKAEAKSVGLNVKLIAACVRLMLLEQDKQSAAIREHSELDLYLNAVGLLADFEADAREASAATPAVTPPVAQNEGQPVQVGTASDEAPERGVGSHTAGQSEEFVTMTGAGEAVAAAVEPASASDEQVLRESVSEIRRDAGGRGQAHMRAASVATGAPDISRESASDLDHGPGVVLPSGGKSGERPFSGTGRESPGTPSEQHRAFLASLPPLDPNDQLFEIRFKARHGRDPLPEDRA